MMAAFQCLIVNVCMYHLWTSSFRDLGAVKTQATNLCGHGSSGLISCRDHLEHK